MKQEAYVTRELEAGVVVLEFAEYVDQLRRSEDDQRAFALVDENELLVCDLSATVELVSRWLKLLARMSDRAREAGKQVILVGLRDSIRQTSDWLGLSEDLVLADSIDEAIRK